MKNRKQLYKYIISDILTSLVAWSILNGIRMMGLLHAEFSYHFLIPEYNARIVYPLVPFFWLFLYWLSGYYENVWFKSRLSEFFSTLLVTIIGSIVLFFVIIIDDNVSDYFLYYQSLFTLMGLHFGLTYIVRLIITTNTAKRIESGDVGFNTLILGIRGRAKKLYKDLKSTPKSTGYIIKGFVDMEKKGAVAVPKDMILGKESNLMNIIESLEISDVIIATENTTEAEIYSIMGRIGASGVHIKVIPTEYQLITGSVKLNTIYGIPMIDLTAIKMSDCEVCIKRFCDIVISLFAMVLLSPLYLLLFALIGKKPIHAQERIGLHGKPFMMYKFRSMIIGAENGTPMLTSENDSRVTKLGAFMRKYRIDELPQFYNVLCGDMSIVGPRPERQYFIDQIVREAPYYYMLQNVKPGITSWGMVKFGYANTVSQMIERASYDILYLENASALVDMKISIYTLKTIFTGEGM